MSNQLSEEVARSAATAGGAQEILSTISCTSGCTSELGGNRWRSQEIDMNNHGRPICCLGTD